MRCEQSSAVFPSEDIVALCEAALETIKYRREEYRQKMIERWCQPASFLFGLIKRTPDKEYVTKILTESVETRVLYSFMETYDKFEGWSWEHPNDYLADKEYEVSKILLLAQNAPYKEVTLTSYDYNTIYGLSKLL